MTLTSSVVWWSSCQPSWDVPVLTSSSVLPSETRRRTPASSSSSVIWPRRSLMSFSWNVTFFLTWCFDFDRKGRNPTSCDHRSRETHVSIQPSLCYRNNSTAQQSCAIKMYLQIVSKCPFVHSSSPQHLSEWKVKLKEKAWRRRRRVRVREQWWEAEQSGPSCRPNSGLCWCAGSSSACPVCSLNLETLIVGTEAHTHTHTES